MDISWVIFRIGSAGRIVNLLMSSGTFVLFRANHRVAWAENEFIIICNLCPFRNSLRCDGAFHGGPDNIQLAITNIHDGPNTDWRGENIWQTQTYNPPLQRKVRRTCCLEFINWRLTTLHHPPVLPPLSDSSLLSVSGSINLTRGRERESGSF